MNKLFPRHCRDRLPIALRGDHVPLAPPLIIDDEHIDEIVVKLVRALDSTLAAI